MSFDLCPLNVPLVSSNKR